MTFLESSISYSGFDLVPTCGPCTVVMVITTRFGCAHGARVSFILFSLISSTRPFIIKEIDKKILDRQEEYTPNMSLSGIQYSSGGLEHHFKDPFSAEGVKYRASVPAVQLNRFVLVCRHPTPTPFSRRQGILLSNLAYRHLFILAVP